jgi:ribosomal protein L40E
MPKTLKDCPHCHARQNDIVPHPDGNGTTPALTVETWYELSPMEIDYVLCNKCGARGPEKKTAMDAKCAWGYK